MSDPQSNWSGYFEAMLTMPLHPHYANLDPHLPHGGEALDLGCGVGQGVVHLASKGFHVTAVDAEAEALEHLRKSLPNGARVTVVQSCFLDFALKSYDVVVAHFSLFFVPPKDYAEFWPKLVASIRPGGLLSIQFLGRNDEWASGGTTTHSRDEVETLLAPFDVLFLEEVERDGATAERKPKHWHVFHVVARLR